MAVCPAGHSSSSDDFCDVCGLLIGPMSQAQPTANAWGSPSKAPGAGAGSPPPPGGGAGPAGAGPAGAAGPGAEAAPAGGPECPNCGTARTGKFCEGCGFNYDSGLLPDGTSPSRRQGMPSGRGSVPAASQYPPTARLPLSPSPAAPGPAAPPAAAPPPAPPVAPGAPWPSASAPEAASPAAPAPAWAPPGNSAGTAPAAAPSPAAPGPVSWSPPPDSRPGGTSGAAYPYPGPVSPEASSGQSGPRPPSWSGTWAVIIGGDRGYYDRVRAASGPDAEGIEFPSYVAERKFALTGTEMRIGRQSASRGLYPEIDLTGPPTDPGISRLHAVLIARQGNWCVLDPGSANGTQLNGTEIPVNEEVPLREGDRINVGAWTVITISRG